MSAVCGSNILGLTSKLFICQPLLLTLQVLQQALEGLGVST